MSTASPQDRRIPVSVLSGFLGAGKSTLLNHLLGQPQMRGAAVLINEFGEVGVDHHIVEVHSDRLVLLDSGCLCCTVRGELPGAFKDLYLRSLRREIAPISRLLLETTGLANPAPLLHVLMEDFFIAERFRPDGIITVVDALAGPGQLDRHREATAQVVAADRLIISKVDLADQDAVDALETRLARLNPTADRLYARHGQVVAERLCGLGPCQADADPMAAARWLGAARLGDARPAYRPPSSGSAHDRAVTSHLLRFHEPLDWASFAEALDVLLQAAGERILRIKGLANITGVDGPRVVQCVGNVRFTPRDLPAWPPGGPHTSLIFIVDGLERDYLVKVFEMFCDRTAGD
ncbi:MAG: GTP-binding protein [Rhodocyclaceae bacterium]|nr:GTP-binding protein [Rhodocyclaceae bacterium]